MEWLLELDGNLLLWIQEYIRNDVLTPVFKLITSLGNAGMIWIVFTAVLLILPRTRKIGLMSMTALLLSLVINNMWLKNQIARTRPYEVIPGLTLLVGKAKDYSFPSGHSSASFASAMVLFLSSRYHRQNEKAEGTGLSMAAGINAMILALLISFSRLYVGIHYPTDVLCGILSGALIGYGVFHFYKRKRWI